MPTYEERLREVRKRRYRAKPGSEAQKLIREEEKLFSEEMKRRPMTTEEEAWKRRFETDPSLVREVGYAGEAAQERPEEETPLLTNILERVTRKRPTMFIGETPEEIKGAKTAGAERAILGRPSPAITFDKFGEPIIEEKAIPSETVAPRGAPPSKEDMDLNEKWTDFRKNYFIPQIGYDPRKINPMQERINTENQIMSGIDINSLSEEQHNKFKKEAEKRGKMAEELAKDKIKIGQDKETQAFELFKTDMVSRQKETRKLSFKEVNDYLYKMTHDSTGGSYELSPTDLTQLQQMARESGYEIVEDIVTPGKERPFWWDKEAEKGYFVKPMDKAGAIPNIKQGALNNLLKNLERMPSKEKQTYLQRRDVQEYANKYGIRGQDLGL